MVTGIGLSARSIYPLTAEVHLPARERDPTRVRQPPACSSGLRVVAAGVAHLLWGLFREQFHRSTMLAARANGGACRHLTHRARDNDETTATEVVERFQGRMGM